ncbi:AAA family ATPase [Canibacter sp. lx-45]|uniref:shikimate kinase n=1 Tax=Canibacter zhuwentaonis TaxID=2837491 RepID=UPI001BDCD15F|nr:shikimate kinase [Canibacter zhuwentaonis]MBT1035036.1 AAA family ATPase [Canibacter zhuwentaonis]
MNSKDSKPGLISWIGGKRPVPAPPKQGSNLSQLPQKAVVFIGPMAAGKTTIGKTVAKELKIPFIDTDARIVHAHGQISDIFANQGEAEFRRLEASVVKRELAEPGCRIVALGGGAILSSQTRKILKNHPVILLMTSEHAITRDGINLSKRPLLKKDPGAWTKILQQRSHLYKELASVEFRTDINSSQAVKTAVIEWLKAGRPDWSNRNEKL